jgi:hypothetical protein
MTVAAIPGAAPHDGPRDRDAAAYEKALAAL